MDQEQWLRQAIRTRVADLNMTEEHVQRAIDHGIMLWKKGNIRGEDVLRETKKAARGWL